MFYTCMPWHCDIGESPIVLKTQIFFNHPCGHQTKPNCQDYEQRTAGAFIILRPAMMVRRFASLYPTLPPGEGSSGVWLADDLWTLTLEGNLLPPFPIWIKSRWNTQIIFLNLEAPKWQILHTGCFQEASNVEFWNWVTGWYASRFFIWWWDIPDIDAEEKG